ncbi:MAG: NYN domain-containing protein [bacterium]|nr:NYN domain-containing protein [bacterium]MCY4163054.1 NYN domain-containing protein [bacterium]MCY4258402.1 NYN domain-containing protein [bacterium]
MIVVDAMNVIGCRPDGWWKDRDGALVQLVEDMQDAGVAALVVADGAPVRGFPAGTYGSVRLAYATRRGPNAADDSIASQVAAMQDPTRATVVTSDKDLANRVSQHGAVVIGARAFRNSLESRLSYL